MSTAVTTSTQAKGDLQLQRPARALIGWMAAEEGAQWLAGQGQPVGDDHREAATRARANVAARNAAVDHEGALRPMPESLVAHREALRNNSASAIFFAEGWEIAIADLRRICAIQRHVLSDDATQRVAAADAEDITSIAAVALPVAEPKSFPAVFDTGRQAWVFSSANPNLRIMGQFHGTVQPGLTAFGFAVTVAASYLQVARYRNRLLLRDGYHRAYGFLARGITHVPVLTREFAGFDDMKLPAGLLPQDAYLGERPPVLSDYVDNGVSASVAMPVTQKVVIIQALELATLG